MENQLGNQKPSAKGVWESIVAFFKETLAIESETDKRGTIKEIKANIPIQGHTAWILVFSIIVASIGLNVSSTAVVIGAMLISPLMGPILGVGLSIGINDVDTLRQSLINLGIMVVLSLITSAIFFSIPLFNEATPEILARTKPDVRDVLIAIAGGTALIVAISRPSAQTNTVAGVAIATALMPPLCTAGFGLGTGQWAYFGGAMFLFLINTIFIALATFIIVKFLNFPVVQYIEEKNKKNISRIVTTIAILVFGFSIYSFVGLYMENSYTKQAHQFINQLKNEGVSIIGDEDEDNISYEKQEITVFIFGHSVSQQKIAQWQKDLDNYSQLQETHLVIKQKDDSAMEKQVKNLTDLYAQNQKIIASRDASIQDKERVILELQNQLTQLNAHAIPFAQVADEVKINHTGVEKLSYAMQLNTNFKAIDTIKVFDVLWYDSISTATINKETIQLEKWLKTRLNLDTLVIHTILSN